MTGLLELLVGLLAAWRGFGQWNGQWNPIVRTTGASGPLGCMERVWAMESHIKNRVFLPLTPINPYFHPMTGLLELLVGLLAAWRGFGQWNGQWNPIVRTTGASGPLGCMERVWAMESHIKNMVFLPLTPINPYFHPMTGLLELLVGLLAAWRGFGQWNGQWNPIVRTTGASRPLNGIPYQE